MASSSNNECMKSEDLCSSTSSGSCTEPLTNEELSRDYEMPRVFNFPPTRRSSFSPSSSSPSSSSPSSSSSSSPATDSSKAVSSVPQVVTSSSLRVPSQLPIQQPSSDVSFTLFGVLTSETSLLLILPISSLFPKNSSKLKFYSSTISYQLPSFCG